MSNYYAAPLRLCKALNNMQLSEKDRSRGYNKRCVIMTRYNNGVNKVSQ